MGSKWLSPGFRFHPTDVELVMYYLKRKVLGKRLHFEAIAVLDIYHHSPWDLPDRSLMKTGDLKWYFFCPRGKKYSSGSRVNRATDIGYWKTTGKDRSVNYKNEVVGMIKTLVFHTGKAPKGDRTDWVMYEYRLAEKFLSDIGVAQDSYVLCSIFKKDGPGPKNGAQYGKPFNEEDWDDDDDDDDDDGDVEVEVMNCIGAVSCAALPIDQNQNQPAVSGLLSPDALPSTSNSVSVAADNHNASVGLLHDSIETDDIDAMLANFTEQYPPAPDQNDVNEVNIPNQGDMENDHNHIGNNGIAPFSDGVDIFEDLGDLGNLGRYNKYQDGISASHNFAYSMEDSYGTGNGQFLELMDLDVPLSCCSNAEGYEIVRSDLHNFADRSSSVELLSGSEAFGMTSETRSGQTSQPIQRGSFQ